MNGARRFSVLFILLITITAGAPAGAAPNQVVRATWDLQLSVPAYLSDNLGAEYDGRYFYTCRPTSGTIRMYDRYGSYQWTMGIPGVTSLADLAHDGRYLYGGGGGYEIFVIDVDAEILQGTIITPVPVWHLAYDQDHDAFWVGDSAGEIILVDRDGAALGSIPAVNHGLSGIQGSAYDNWSEGGPFLWLFDQGAGEGSPQLIHQISLTTLEPTGLVHDVAADLTAGNDLAGGLFLTPSIVAGTVSLGGVMQGDNETLFCYELTAWTAPASYLVADFDEHPLDVPVGTGGPAQGEPVRVDVSTIATVRDGPLPTPSLEIQDNSSTSSGAVTFGFDEGFEVSQGNLEISADLWFPESSPGNDFYLYLRERGSAAQSFLNLEFRSSGDVWCYDSDSYNGIIGSFDNGREIALRIRVDLAAATYSVWVDGALGIAAEPHGITGHGVGSLLLGCDYDDDLVGTFYVDNIRAADVAPVSGVGETTPERPARVDLDIRSHPNPFNPRTTIHYRLPASGPVALVVFDMRGRLTRSLAGGHRDAGSYDVVWDGTDESGRPVAAGSYLYRLRFAGHEQLGKLCVVK